MNLQLIRIIYIFALLSTDVISQIHITRRVSHLNRALLLCLEQFITLVFYEGKIKKKFIIDRESHVSKLDKPRQTLRHKLSIRDPIG